MPPDIPAAKLRPVGPSTTTRPPVMYSQPWSPTPSTTAVASGQLRAEQRADGAVDVADRQLDPDRPPALEGWAGQLDQRPVERPIQAVVLSPGLVQLLAVVAVVGHLQNVGQVQPVRLP